ncbi:MAG TPA: RtcB family protein [Thermoanaerobaculia bacterium]|jgi:tRNA-splicing ligase RtcB|nr:RtcB family protein [Thermoanaerobaculia bacterium]
MNAHDMARLGVPPGEATRRGVDFIARFVLAGGDRTRLDEEVEAVMRDPSAYIKDPLRGDFAKALLAAPPQPRKEPVPYRRWGEGLEPEALLQMERACQLPVTVAGALMPDAHPGYGLPIGGVLATENAVIPYAVGVDIACRMKMTVLDLPVRDLERKAERLRKAIETETRFGVGATFRDRREHPVLDEDWSVSPITRENKDRAWSQLGTSGSGNHFVELGVFTVSDSSVGLPEGEHVALLSHSGSRGTGAEVCSFYSKRAVELHPELPKELRRLAWLSLDSAEGQEYWAAMELMGHYAAANHAVIHQHVASHLGAEVLLDLENHHNFAWKENHFGRDVVVHRKGATPAGEGVLGIIPGSMAAPGFVVRGKGHPDSLNSAAHGAGRAMSRKAAVASFTWEKARHVLKQRGVTLLSAGLDEVPMAYKDIHQVMAAQADLVEVLGRFDPKLVKMAPSGEPPED